MVLAAWGCIENTQIVISCNHHFEIQKKWSNTYTVNVAHWNGSEIVKSLHHSIRIRQLR